MANAGFTFVEQWTYSTTHCFDVYKSPGASNAIGTDWYIAFGWAAAAATSLAVRLFEQWDATNKKAIKYAPSATSVPASDGSVNDATGLLLNDAGLFQNASGGGATAVSSITYYFNITIDRVWFATSAPAVFYFGSHDRLLSSSDDPMPLAMCAIYFGLSATATLGASTRELKNIGAATYNFFVQTGYGSSLNVAWAVASTTGFNAFGPGVGLEGADSIYFSGAYPVCRPMIHPSRGYATTNRGVCKPGLYITGGVAGVAGDTATLTRADGTTQSCVWVNSYMYLATS
jgi:hypothetical protein